MPLYDYKCDVCGHTSPVLARIEERNRLFACDNCGRGTMRRVEVSAFRVAADYPGYESPASGKWIEGRVAHRNDLAATGCRVREAGETEAFIKNKAAAHERSWERAIESSVGAAVRELGLS